MSTQNAEAVIIYNNSKANSTTVWLLFLFLGWSYGSLGKMGLQILYYLTLGGCGVWTLVRLFTLSSAIKQYNTTKALAAGMDSKQMAMVGLI